MREVREFKEFKEVREIVWLYRYRYVSKLTKLLKFPNLALAPLGTNYSLARFSERSTL